MVTPGLDANQKGIRGARPLHYAAWGNYSECALILVSRGEDGVWKETDISSEYLKNNILIFNMQGKTHEKI